MESQIRNSFTVHWAMSIGVQVEKFFPDSSFMTEKRETFYILRYLTGDF
jgi:hypothetical protein